MAKSMSKNTNNTRKPVTAKPSIVEVIENITEEVIDPVVDVEEVKKIIRKFEPDDLITCTSITSGELLMVGEKTNSLYRWADRGDEQDVEYQDLIFAVRKGSGFVFKPRFIIKDEDFLDQNPSVKEKYETMYTLKDIKDVLALSPQAMKQTILELPDGAKDSLKSVAATMITNGSLDSVAKIKILDEIFDTQLMLMTELM